MRCTFWIFFTFLISYHTFANEISLKGKVQSNKGEVLPYCHITVGNCFGTISNSEGRFILYVPDSVLSDTLKASYMGFTGFSIPLNAIEDTNNIVITLTENRYLLDEINVYPISATDIIDSMIKYRYCNVDTGLIQLSFFLRESNKINGKYYRFAEGVFKIYRYGYRGDLIELGHARFIKKIGDQEVTEHFIGIADSCKFFLEGRPYDLFKIERMVHNFFNKERLKQHEFNIAGSTTVENEEAYIIEFDQKDRIRKQLYNGTIVITKQDFALVSMEYSYSPKGSKYIKSETPMLLRPYFTIKQINNSLHLKYSKKGNKWYPVYISDEYLFYYKLKVSTYKDEFTQCIKDELLVNMVDRNATFKINKNKVINEKFDFSGYEKDYNDGFWLKYNQISPEKELEQFIKTIP